FINQLLEDTPFLLQEGRIGCISVSIPWSKLLNSPSTSAVIEEHIMSSSLHFADDFLRTEIDKEDLETKDTMDMDIAVLSKVIDKMISRIKIDVVDTLVRIIHTSAVPLSPNHDGKEYYIDIRIPRISYFDETPEFNTTTTPQDMMNSSVLLPPVANETIKIITISSPEIWLRSAESSPTTEDDLAQTEFFDSYSGLDMSGSITPKPKPYEALLFTTMDKKNWIRLKLRPLLDGISAMSIKQIDVLVTHIRILFTPQQLAFFMDLLDLISSDLPKSAPATWLEDVEIILERKIKVQMSLIELLLVSQDEPALVDRYPAKDKHHLRFALHQLSIRQQQFTNRSSVMDMRIPNLVLDEWIPRPLDHRTMPSQTQYDQYNPIFQLDSRIKQDYHENDPFPAYYPSQQPIDNTDMVRIRIENRQTKASGRFIDAMSFEQDIHVDLPAFTLHLDPRLLDRMDSYREACMKPKETKPMTSQPTPSIFDDLQTQQNTRKTKVRLKCAFIRVLLSVPDMSAVSTRKEFNDQFHQSQLSVDIKKLVATWCSLVDDHTTGALENEDHTHKPETNKVNIDLNYVNVFMQSRPEDMVKCWFTAKTVHDSKKSFSEGISPSIEITIQDTDTYPTPSARSGYFGAGSEIPANLFDYLEKNESFHGEQKLHIPMEDQSDSAMIFKQRTIETSLFVVNCHFPQADMNLSKDIWDQVQIIQNDLLLWQPRFVLAQENMEASDMKTASSCMSQSHERFVLDQVQQQTLFSIVAVMSHGCWDLNTSPSHTYRLQFSDFRYFAAMQHLGKKENITTLDIEELDLFDVSNQMLPLIHKTIPKKIHPKRNTSMVSLFSRLTLLPEFNRIHKVTSVVACHLCWKATAQLDVIQQLIEFQKVPSDMVFIDPPTQYIKVYAHLLETSIHYAPHPLGAVVVLDGVQVMTNMLAGQPILQIKAFIQHIELYLMDDMQELHRPSDHQQQGMTDARTYWSTLGFVSTLTVQNIELCIKLKLDDYVAAPQVDLAIVSTDISLDTSADAFQTLMNVMTFVQHAKHQPSSSPTHHATCTMHKEDMLTSLDEDAFKISPSQLSPPTLIEAPEMEEFNYVEEFYHNSEASSSSSYYSTTRLPPTKPRRQIHRSRTSEDMVRVLEEDRLQLVEDYFGLEKQVRVPKSMVDLSKAIFSLRVSNLNVVWKLYDGYAWDYVRSDMATKQQTGFGDHLDKRRHKKDAHIEFRLDHVSIDLDVMSDNDPTAMYLNLNIKDVEIIDNIKTSNWKKFLGYMRSDAEQREMDECMVHIELFSLRPVQHDPQQEFRLKVKLLPIRLYVDQDPLDFLEKFFSFDKSNLRSTHAANQSIPQAQEDEEVKDVYFQHVDIHPLVFKVDYKPKHFKLGNVKEGQYLELIKLFHLDGAEVSLTHVKLTGIKGWSSLLDRLGQAWLPHLKQTSQVFHVASGVPPVRSLVNLGTGVADLVLLPIQQYKKDGRLMKGIQRGTSSFARATAIEAIKLGSKMATGTQVILEHADGFFSSPPHSSMGLDQQYHFVYTDEDDLQIIRKEELLGSDHRPSTSHEQKKPYEPSPSEGLYQHMNKTLAAQTIFAAVIRAVPVAVIKPMIGLTSALQSILTGLRSSIDPVMRLQSEDKYKKPK
ncbi:autophagy- protein 2, partial [Rhizopus stolonifer]